MIISQLRIMTREHLLPEKGVLALSILCLAPVATRNRKPGFAWSVLENPLACTLGILELEKVVAVLEIEAVSSSMSSLHFISHDRIWRAAKLGKIVLIGLDGLIVRLRNV